MKKFTFLFTFLIASVVVFAQSSTSEMMAKKFQDPSVVVTAQAGNYILPAPKGAALNEDFEDTTVAFPPAGWTMIDLDGDGSNWNFYRFNPHSGLHSAASASWTGSALTPINYLITPALMPVTGDSITWWVAPQDPDWPADKYAVVISTTGNAAEDFTTDLFEETLTTPDSIWVRRAVSLDAYNGQMVYIAFKHYDCTDNFMMKIDDVTGPATSGVGVNTATIDNSISVYPNPVNSILNIKSSSKVLNIRMYNILGQTVMTSSPRATHATVNTSDFNSGIYFVYIETENGVMQQKVTVTK